MEDRVPPRVIGFHGCQVSDVLPEATQCLVVIDFSAGPCRERHTPSLAGWLLVFQLKTREYVGSSRHLSPESERRHLVLVIQIFLRPRIDPDRQHLPAPVRFACPQNQQPGGRMQHL